MNVPKIPLDQWVDWLVSWLQNHFKPLFDFIIHVIQPMVHFFQSFFLLLPPWGTIILITLFTWWMTRLRFAFFTLVGLLFIHNLGYWQQSVETLSLVLTATVISIVIGIPLGLLAGKSELIHQILRPVLDFMQTMPAFVYLIPAVLFFSLGTIPGVIASVIFSMPPTIRLTSLGLRQVDKELREVAEAFGSTTLQKLIKVEIPLAKPTIFAGINQTIMLSLSMVVVASMIGAEGLGAVVLESIQRLEVGTGFVAGLSIVIIAILLDRLTQTLSKTKSKHSFSAWRRWTGVFLSLVFVIMAITSVTQMGESDEKKVTLAYVNWESELASTHVVKHVLQKQGYTVELKQVEAGPMWQGVATGSVDAHVAGWLPTTHKPQMEKSKDKVENLGPNLEGTQLGLAVPDYVPIQSIEELPAVSDRFNNEIIGIDPGAGIMKGAQMAIQKYRLPLRLVQGSDAAMTASLSKAISKKQWIVITGWKPHWKFSQYKLKFLADPKGTFGKKESIYTIVRKGLKEDKPEVYQILDRFHWTTEDMQEVMLAIHKGKTPDEAAQDWINKHPAKVKQWLPD